MSDKENYGTLELRRRRFLMKPVKGSIVVSCVVVLMTSL